MAVLSTFEKYPDSWRIDHPDFGDVCKTSFVKGVISEVKTDIGSPEVLENLESVAFSLVKVKVGGGESLTSSPSFTLPRRIIGTHLFTNPRNLTRTKATLKTLG